MGSSNPHFSNRNTEAQEGEVNPGLLLDAYGERDWETHF